MTDTIHYQRDGEVAVIRLDDGKVNAMDHIFFDGVNAVLDQVEKDNAKALVLTGRPGRFSAGLNIRIVPTLNPEELKVFGKAFGQLMLRVYNLPIPTIAAVNGHAIAGGVILACTCDVRIGVSGDVGRESRFHLSEIQIGIPLPSFAIHLVDEVVSRSWRAPFILHAQRLNHPEAAEAGLLHELVDPDKLLEHAVTRAKRLNINRAAYRISKARLRAPHFERLNHQLEHDGFSLEG